MIVFVTKYFMEAFLSGELIPENNMISGTSQSVSADLSGSLRSEHKQIVQKK